MLERDKMLFTSLSCRAFKNRNGAPIPDGGLTGSAIITHGIGLEYNLDGGME